MKKYLILIGLLLIPSICLGAAPVRQYDYVDKEIIEADEVTANEDVVFDYLQAGIDVLATDSVNATHIDWGTGANQVSQDDVVDGATYKQYNPASVTITGGTITGITDLAVADGGTGASTLSSGYILLGNGTSAIATLDVTGNGSIIIGDGTTAPTTLSAFTNSTGTLKHESGGLEADVSGYTNGIYGQLVGATANIDTSAEIISAISDETGTGNLVFSGSPTLTGTAIVASINASGTVTGSVVDTQYLEYSSGGALTVRDDLTVTGAFTTGSGGSATNWDAAYTHSIDNTQAHSDYLINNGDDLTSGSLSMVNCIASGTVTGIVVDTQYLEYGGGTAVTVRDDLTITGDIIVTDITTTPGNLAVSGTITEGGNAIYNSSETPGGELGGTWASPTIDDSIAVTSWNLTTPTITTSLTTSTPTTISVAELDRLDGLSGIIVTDATACTDLEGTGLAIGAGTLNFTSTEIEATTWGAGGNASNIWTFNLSGTDWTMTAGSALATFSAGVTISGTTTIGTLAGTIDAGAATSLEIPNGANPTTDAAGEIAVDSSAAPGSGIRFYGDAAYTIAGTYSKSFVILNPVATDDYPVWRSPYAITITHVHVQCLGGTNIVGQLTECDAEGINPAVVDSADITATANNSVDDDGTLSNPSIDAGDYVGWATTSISGTPTSATVTFDYIINQVN